jgi:hypothetical protein
MSTEWPALSSSLTWDHKLTRRRARSRQSHRGGGPETLCGCVAFRQPNLCRTAVWEIAPYGPPLGKLLARLPNAGPFIHDRRSSSHSPTGIRESWRATAVQAANTTAVALSLQLLDFLANNALRPWAAPSSAGAGIHFGSFFVGDLHVTHLLQVSGSQHKTLDDCSTFSSAVAMGRVGRACSF